MDSNNNTNNPSTPGNYDTPSAIPNNPTTPGINSSYNNYQNNFDNSNTFSPSMPNETTPGVSSYETPGNTNITTTPGTQFYPTEEDQTQIQQQNYFPKIEKGFEVKIIQGEYSQSIGVVQSVNIPKNTCTVLIDGSDSPQIFSIDIIQLNQPKKNSKVKIISSGKIGTINAFDESSDGKITNCAVKTSSDVLVVQVNELAVLR
jgi:hypothetical protein